MKASLTRRRRTRIKVIESKLKLIDEKLKGLKQKESDCRTRRTKMMRASRAQLFTDDLDCRSR
jgi:hypothetical protein